jgi:small subunit ribosomal protein S27Ae
VLNGKPLADSELLSLAGVEEEQTLYILGRLLGGGKKRKKKTYTKPKKQKHKHKKIKLRVLKFYKVCSRRAGTQCVIGAATAVTRALH